MTSAVLPMNAMSVGPPNPMIGAVSYPDGKFRTITNDTNHYVGLSLSANADGLVSVVGKTTATIEVWRGDGSGAPTQIVEARETIRGFDWTAMVGSCIHVVINSSCTQPPDPNGRCSSRT